MLFASRGQRWSLFVPALLVLLAGGMLAVSLEQLRRAPSVGVGVGCLITLGILLFVLGEVRFVHERGSHIWVRTLFGVKTLEAATTVVSVATVHGGRGGVRNQILVADSEGQRACVAELWTRGGAARARERLAETFERRGVDIHREQVRAALASEAAVQAQFSQAEAYVKKYYASGTHRKTLYAVAAVLVLYVLGTAVYALMTGASL